MPRRDTVPCNRNPRYACVRMWQPRPVRPPRSAAPCRASRPGPGGGSGRKAPPPTRRRPASTSNRPKKPLFSGRQSPQPDGWRHHAAFERRRDALVFLDTTAAALGNESVTTAPPKRSETPGPSQQPPQSSPCRTPKGPITHDLDETRSQDIPWSLCGVLLYDPRQIAKDGDLPEVSAVPVGGQLPETPSSDEGGEEDLTGRPPGVRLPRSLRGGPRNGSSV